MVYRIIGVVLAIAGFMITSSSTKELRVLLAGGLLTLVGVLLLVGIVDIAKLVRRELWGGKQLESAAQGVVEKTQVTGTYVNESPMVQLTVAFRDSADTLRHARTKKVVQLVDLPKYAEGSPVNVQYRFDDPGREVTVQALPLQSHA
ncbi:hypothetical protein J7E49_04980 [Variovorax paradoxus]|nr:hypothetical protein [Variovorax paradoxus]